MDLKRRLAQLDKLTRRPVDAPRPAGPGSSCLVDQAATLAALDLVERATAAGPVWSRERIDAIAPPVSPLPDLAGLFTREGNRRPAVAELLFLDTETTGLAGGTGTLAFQVGTSWWQGGLLHTRQYFLPGPEHEGAMLTALAALAAGFALVVTYNGASFDLPLLRTRALLNRVPDPLGHLANWDLLVPARRLWGNRLADCRQQTLEQEVCGRRRSAGDIDGARIPQTWFDFLCDGQPGLLGNVLTHNQRDMLGMVDLFGLICQVAGQLELPVDEVGRGPWQDRPSAWALGRICEFRSAPAAAGDWFRRAWSLEWGGLADPGARQRFRRDAVRNLKRCQAWDLVEEILAEGLACDPLDGGLHREAAILYEHRLVDIRRAEYHAERAGDEYRLARLRRTAGTGQA